MRTSTGVVTPWLRATEAMLKSNVAWSRLGFGKTLENESPRAIPSSTPVTDCGDRSSVP
jgi:hypothetical protein